MILGSDYQASCLKKVKYGREATANRAAVNMAEKHGRKFDVYKCSYCESWHIGKTLPKIRVKMPENCNWREDGSINTPMGRIVFSPGAKRRLIIDTPKDNE